MKYLLDTNTCVLFMNRANASLSERLRRCHPSDVWVSVITLAELLHCVEHSDQRGASMEKLVVFRSRVQTLSFDEDAAGHFGVIHASLSHRGIRMGPFDTLIAAHAISAGLTLVTDNVREFRRVKGLRVENWLPR